MTTQATSAPSRKDAELETTPPREQVEERADYRYLERGRTNGHDLDDWLTAEAECAQASCGTP